MHTRIILLAIVLIPLGLRAQSDNQPQPPPAPPPAPEAASSEAARELAAKQAELSTVTEQITDLQLQAEKQDTVKTAKGDYRQVLREEMVRTTPALAADIDRQTALVEELQEEPPGASEVAPAPAAGQSAPPDDGQAKLEEYRRLRDKLTPIEQGVQAVPAVQTARQTYYDALIAEMQRLEPKTPELLARHRELVSVIRELTAQAGTG